VELIVRFEVASFGLVPARKRHCRGQPGEGALARRGKASSFRLAERVAFAEASAIAMPNHQGRRKNRVPRGRDTRLAAEHDAPMRRIVFRNWGK
jgi:hypothetical protein